MKGSRKRPPEEGNEGAEKREKRKGHKLHGLYNQGATCYLNSVLQVLSMTTEIHDRLNSSLPTDQALGKIFEGLNKTEIITKSLDITNVHQQRDAAECLEMILHKVSPEASEVFRGELKCSTKCSEGHSIIEETNLFLTLPLSLKDAHDTNYSVERGFEKIFQKTSFSGDNMVYCNKCKKKTKATSECEMVKFPEILTLLLKRFVFDYNAMSHVKSDRSVDVPSELQKKNKTYKLYGIVNHMGGLRGGHYTATILSNEDQTWYEFDDTRVEKVDEQPFSKTETYKSRTAYLLMYRDTGSPRTKKTGRQGKVSHVDEQKENKVKGNSRLEPKQGSQRELRQVTKEEAPKHKVRKVDSDEIYIKEDNAVFSSGQHPKAWMPEVKRKQSNKKYEFDDTHVEKVDEQPFAKTETYNSRTAYPLMYRATGSPITNRTERQDEVSHVDEQKGNKVEGNSRLEQNQEKQLGISKAKKKDAPNPKVRAVEGDERSRKVSRLGEDIIKADNAVHQNQISGYSSRQHPKTPEARRTQSSKKYDVVRPTFPLEENPQQPCKRAASILKKPLVIVVIVIVCALIVILPVVLTTLRK